MEINSHCFNLRSHDHALPHRFVVALRRRSSLVDSPQYPTGGSVVSYSEWAPPISSKCSTSL